MPWQVANDNIVGNDSISFNDSFHPYNRNLRFVDSCPDIIVSSERCSDWKTISSEPCQS